MNIIFICPQLDLPLSLVFFKWLLGQEHTLTASDIHHIDPVLAKSFQQLDDLLRQKKRIESDRSHVSSRCLRHLSISHVPYSLSNAMKINCVRSVGTMDIYIAMLYINNVEVD